jgi:hypothetical protein
MEQLAHVLVFGTDDEFLNLLDQGATTVGELFSKI